LRELTVSGTEALQVAERIGYPLMVRPSYVLGGRGMEVVHDEEDLTLYVSRAVEIWPNLPILIIIWPEAKHMFP
jgi:carbamoyl-phosphate synthase large subunit